MSAGSSYSARLPQAFMTPGISSFSEFLRHAAPEALPNPQLAAANAGDIAPHGTTIVAAIFPGGAVVAGDRRATMGNVIASRDIEKVRAADAHSLIGYAGTAGIGIELVRLFCVELEHYEKIEGTPLSLEGKANRLASMVRGNLAMAMQGLAVVPLFAGYDLDADLEAGADPGRIFSFDAAGGCYREENYHAVGSGSPFAKAALKKRHDPAGTEEQTVRACLDALYDAADEDSATGGPDLIRKIYPVVAVVDAEGVRRLTDDQVGAVVEQLVADRHQNPGG